MNNKLARYHNAAVRIGFICLLLSSSLTLAQEKILCTNPSWYNSVCEDILWTSEKSCDATGGRKARYISPDLAQKILSNDLCEFSPATQLKEWMPRIKPGT